MNKFLLAGVPLVVLIPFIVEGLKRLFPKLASYGAFVAVGVSAVLVGAVAAVDWKPELDKPVQYALAALLFAITFGLSGSGAFSQAKSLKKDAGSQE